MMLASGKPSPSQRPLGRRAPRAGEALLFPAASAPLVGGRSADVALAGLRVFVLERFGSVSEAFKRMDFHHDGRISCLEFQEVLSGQERYCGLREARELFCLLARGSDGWIFMEDFERNLRDSDQFFKCGAGTSSHAEGRGAWDWEVETGASCSHLRSMSSDRSEAALSPETPMRFVKPCRASAASSPGDAGSALRHLLFGKAVGRTGDQDADEVTTTAPTLTSRSSQSAQAKRPPAMCAGSSQQESQLSSSRDPWAAAAGAGPGRPCFAGAPCEGQAAGALEHRDLHGDEGRHDGLGAAAHLGGGSSSSSQLALPWPHGSGSGSGFGFGTGQSLAMQSLDQSLVSFREEVAALRSLQLMDFQSIDGSETAVSKPPLCRALFGAAAPSGPCQLDESTTSALGAGVELQQQDGTSQAQAAATVASSSSLWSDFPAGLNWLRFLPWHVHGRLAACSTPAEALAVLDRATDSLPAAQQPRTGQRGAVTLQDSTDSPQRRGRWRSRAAEMGDPAVSTPERIAASAHLLQLEQARVESLEAELAARQRKHEQEVAEIRQRHRSDQRRTLRRLMDRLAPPTEAIAVDRSIIHLQSAKGKGEDRGRRPAATARWAAVSGDAPELEPPRGSSA
eukprot:CAMPEP_0170638754 /NCGR_PEP_ID=MMETSP0224-20130122/39250_1 /TAXON_ID=285029 /ORGANISM="Togula jolla, Strain CCCM 725" /LENGTH=624 /DNA_ID=CAMNT_0010968995 /DNA_START=24 /DNA_END=1895 /DNA_ORIENTATION=+